MFFTHRGELSDAKLVQFGDFVESRLELLGGQDVVPRVALVEAWRLHALLGLVRVELVLVDLERLDVRLLRFDCSLHGHLDQHRIALAKDQASLVLLLLLAG